MYQSGFRKNHSTETALLKVVNQVRTNQVRTNLDKNKLTVLVLHDLSASFDTLDHQILLNRVGEWFGPSAVVLKWFHLYRCGRELFFVLAQQTIAPPNTMRLPVGYHKGLF